MWRLHPEPGSKNYAKGPHWRYCTDTTCELEHVLYEPCRPITGQAIDLSHLPPARYEK